MDVLRAPTLAHPPVLTGSSSHALDQKPSRAPPPSSARLRLIFGLASVPMRDTRPPAGHVERSRVGLCADCQHARCVTSSKGSSFWLCKRAVTDPGRFKKYPPLPVLRCEGFSAIR